MPDHAVSSAAQEAIDFGKQIGMVADAEQRLALDAILSEDDNGDWAAFENALVVARQNLKTWCFRLVALTGMFVFKTELTVWTAHQVPVALEAFRDFKLVLESYDHLRRRVASVTEKNGHEGIELFGGIRLSFKARTKTGGRGLTAPRLFLDEAQELTPSVMGSLMPTMRAVPNPHLLYGGSAGKVLAAYWRSVRNRGRRGGDESLAYVEWAAPLTACASEDCDHVYPTAVGCALDNEKLWPLANPAMRSGRIRISHMRAERRAMAEIPEEFARELMGWWEDPPDDAAQGDTKDGLDLVLWEARRVEREPRTEALAYAVDVAPDSTYAAIAAAFDSPQGVVVVVLKHERSTEWVAHELEELGVRDVWLDPRGPASVLVDELEESGIEKHDVTGTDLTGACASFVDDLQRGSLKHEGQADLDAAVRGAVRSSSDAWRWSRKSSAINIAPLVAVTLAAHGAGVAPEAESEFIVF